MSFWRPLGHAKQIWLSGEQLLRNSRKPQFHAQSHTPPTRRVQKALSPVCVLTSLNRWFLPDFRHFKPFSRTVALASDMQTRTQNCHFSNRQAFLRPRLTPQWPLEKTETSCRPDDVTPSGSSGAPLRPRLTPQWPLEKTETSCRPADVTPSGSSGAPSHADKRHI